MTAPPLSSPAAVPRADQLLPARLNVADLGLK